MPSGKKKKEETDWGKKTPGRKLLLEDIREGRIPDTMDWETVYVMRPEFAVGETPEEAKRLFEGRLKGARKIIHGKNTRAATELTLFQQDRAKRPPPATDHNGLPRWEGSEAQKFLLQDLLNKQFEGDAKGLWQSRPEYHTVYPLAYFRKKRDQEERTQKFLTQYRAKYGYHYDY